MTGGGGHSASDPAVQLQTWKHLLAPPSWHLGSFPGLGWWWVRGSPSQQGYQAACVPAHPPPMGASEQFLTGGLLYKPAHRPSGLPTPKAVPTFGAGKFLVVEEGCPGH